MPDPADIRAVIYATTGIVIPEDPTPDPGSSWAQEDKDGTYYKNLIVSRTYAHMGRLQMPVACDPGSSESNRPASEILQVHAPYGGRFVVYDQVRLGLQPVAPNVMEDDNQVLFRQEIVLFQVIPEMMQHLSVHSLNR